MLQLTVSDQMLCFSFGACLHMLSVLHLQEFNLEKLQLLEQEKAKIRKEYERRESQVEVKKKM
jgi:DNA polymerase elongation subunit (family B)